MKKSFYVYSMASGRNGTLYIGMTSNLPKRVWEHKNKISAECFTAKYNITNLVYYEVHDNLKAPQTEKQGLNFGSEIGKRI